MADITFTAAQKKEAAERELKLRIRVYPRRVDAGYMSQAEADRQIALMRAIVADYDQQLKTERLL